MKTSEILRRAKARLWNGVTLDKHGDVPRGKSAMICYAIMGASFAESDAVCREIMRRIHPYNTLRGWLANQPHVRLGDLTDKNVQRHRRQWVDKLIAEYEAKGD
jgi:hypothetical protein